MSQSPGHQKCPDHKVQEKPCREELQVAINGDIVARSASVIEVDEDNHPPRYYIPRTDVDMDKLSDSNREATCPFKGQGHYFNVNFGSKRLEDAAWSYEVVYDEHQSLKDYIAFHDEMPGVELRRV